MKIFLVIPFLIFTFISNGCFEEVKKPDASGNFEAIEITVSSEVMGKLLKFDIMEGDKINEGELIGIVDTTTTYLQLKQLYSSIEAMRKKDELIKSQVNVYAQQYESIEKEYNRFNKLLVSNAVTEKQVDDIKAQLDLIKKQIESTQVQKTILSAEIKTLEIQAEQIKNQISKSYVYSPINGNILLKISEEKEFITTGSPLLKIANLDNLILRAYISGNQLNTIKIGDEVNVKIDSKENGYYSYKGKVSWIASEAEFTPKVIQTKEERVNLVYAIKIIVENDGKIKIGMPGEVYFNGTN